MGIISSLGRVSGLGTPETKSAQPITLTSPEALPLFGVLPSGSGVTVTAATAMRVAAGDSSRHTRVVAKAPR